MVVVVVSCCLSSRRSGRGEKVEGCWGNELKNLSFFLQCIDSKTQEDSGFLKDFTINILR